jgi:hypothetical protein
MATIIGNLDLGLVVGFFAGIGAFFLGFRVYSKVRLLEDTPWSTISSIAMGFVRIHGKAKSDQLVTSPVTHTPCCYYAVEIMKWQESPNSRTTSYGKDEEEDRGVWMHHGAEADGGWFYLDDSTGRVAVNPRRAQFQLEMTGMREVGGATASSFVAGGVSETELLAYVARVGLGPMIPGVHAGLAMTGALLAEHMQYQAARGGLSQGMADPEKMNRLLEMQAKLRGMSLPPSAALPHLSPQSGDVAPPLVTPPAAAPPLAADPSFSSDHPLASVRYRLIECCIHPDRDYDISGTCAENPVAKDSSDRNLIRKGKNEPTFLISDRARAGVTGMVHKGARLMIFGGGMLAVFCLGLLLLRFGLR